MFVTVSLCVCYTFFRRVLLSLDEINPTPPCVGATFNRNWCSSLLEITEMLWVSMAPSRSFSEVVLLKGGRKRKKELLQRCNARQGKLCCCFLSCTYPKNGSTQFVPLKKSLSGCTLMLPWVKTKNLLGHLSQWINGSGDSLWRDVSDQRAGLPKQFALIQPSGLSNMDGINEGLVEQAALLVEPVPK